MPDTLWFTRCPVPTAAAIALRLGWLEDEFAADNIAVRSLASSADKQVQLSHYKHTQPNSFRFGGYVPPLIARSRGSNICVIGLAQVHRLAGVYVLADSAIIRPTDLCGRRLGVPRRLNDTIDWWRAEVLCGYHFALHSVGLSISDVTFENIEIQRQYLDDATAGAGSAQSLWGAKSQFAVQREELLALARGKIDALFSESAIASIATASLGLRAIIDVGETEDSLNRDPLLLTVDGDLLEQRPDLVTRWLRQLLAAGPWAAANEELAKTIIARDTGLPYDLVDHAFSANVHQELSVSLEEDLICALIGKYKFLRSQGFIETEIDFEMFVAHEPLKAAMQALPDPQK